MEIGTKVGAKRWPNHAAHPDCWEKPHAGVVLSPRDPRSWEGTMAFGSRLPTQAEVDAHVDWIEADVQKREPTLPVEWDFWGRKEVYWETVSSLRPYAQDLAAWTAALWEARHPVSKAA